MLPKRLLDVGASGPELAPRYLGESDDPWLRALLDVYRAFTGRRRRALDERLREPLRPDAPRASLARARHVLDRLCGERTSAPRAPREVRSVVFGEAAREADRALALRRAAERLELEEPELADALFADVPGERRLVLPEHDLDPVQLRLRTNLALVQGLIAHASEVRIEALGNARDLVRYARLRGLLCVARPAADPHRLVLEISGPLALFRRTRVYARALAGLVPRLPWCAEFEARARVQVGETSGTLRLRAGDPIFPATEPKRFDSKIEARFAKDFAKAAPDWDLIREPSPVPVDDTLVFPDFQLRHRRRPDRVWWLEIVGFWTPAYLERKLRRLRRAKLSNLVLCVDASKAAGCEDLPNGARVVPFRRRVDVGAVLEVIVSERDHP